MHETALSYSNLESPSSDQPVRPGQHRLRGWVIPKSGRLFVDVRARIGSRIFAGVHGFPRADLAAHFKIGRTVALAEFAIVIELTSNAAQVVLETLTIEGQWTAFQTIDYQVSADGPPAILETPSAPLRWHEYGRALQVLLREQRRQPTAALIELARKLVAEIPWPRDLRHPHQPFHGFIDEPAALTPCYFGRTAVRGYLFHETQPIKRVLATFDLQAWQTVGHGQPSPGPAETYPQFATAAKSGVAGLIDVPAQLPYPVCLRLYAEMEDGSLHLCSVQCSRLYTNEDAKIPFPPQNTTSFASTHAALSAAMEERGIQIVHDEEMQRELTRRAEDFSRHAPAALTATTPLQAAPLTSTAPIPRRMLLVTHNLNPEGAPLFLLDYARHLASLGSQLTVLSPEEGPLRPQFERLPARVRLIDTAPVFKAATQQEAEKGIAIIADSFDFSGFDLVVCNTFTTFWAVHAAKAAGCRVLLYVHESATPANFYHDRVAPSVLAMAETAFGLANCVSFTTATTRDVHLAYGQPSRHRLTPGWIDVARIDAWRTINLREPLRARFGLQPGELLVTNIGTVCHRKGQHPFARAVDLLWRRYPELAARTRFVMLGGGDTPFDAELADLLTHLGRPNLAVHPATLDYFPYYAAADLFVCSSYEESSPRVILEAMACLCPIIASSVNGVVEQVRPDLEAVLVPPGGTSALCEAMARLLQSPDLGHTLAACARARVLNEFEAGILLPRHAALACTVANRAN